MKMPKNKNILVTGGAGFIGSHLIDKLVLNNKVFNVDNLETRSVNYVNFKYIFIKEDIRNQNFFERITDNIDIVYHLAAQTSVPVSVKNPELDFEINVKGTRNVLEFCRYKDVKKLIFVSSAAVYGNPIYLPIDETHPTNPISPYGEHKLQIEEEIKNFAEKYGIEYVILRAFNVYGPRMKDNVIKILIDAAKNNRPFKLYGDGTQTRDFIYVENIVDLLILSSSIKNEIVNLGSGIETSLNDLLNILKEKFPNLIVEYEEKRQGEIFRSVSDISKMLKLFPHIKIISLKEGINKLLSYQIQ